MQEFAVVMSCVSACVAALFAYLQNRDKFRFDAELAGVRAELKGCHAEREAQRREIVDLEARLAEHVGNCDAHKGA